MIQIKLIQESFSTEIQESLINNVLRKIQKNGGEIKNVTYNDVADGPDTILILYDTGKKPKVKK